MMAYSHLLTEKSMVHHSTTTTVAEQQKAQNFVLNKCISRVMNVNKVYDELHVNLLSLLFYLRVHLPFHRYTHSINCASTKLLIHNLFPYAHTYTHTPFYSCTFSCSLPHINPQLVLLLFLFFLFISISQKKRKAFFPSKTFLSSRE